MCTYVIQGFEEAKSWSLLPDTAHGSISLCIHRPVPCVHTQYYWQQNVGLDTDGTCYKSCAGASHSVLSCYKHNIYDHMQKSQNPRQRNEDVWSLYGVFT